MAARCANAYEDNCLESRCCDDPLHQCMKRETREYAQCRKVKTAFCERQGEWLCPEMWCPGCWPQPPLSSPLPSPPPTPSPPPPPPSPRPPPPPWHDPFFDLQDRPPSPPPRTAPRPSSLLARPFALPPPPLVMTQPNAKAGDGQRFLCAFVDNTLSMVRQKLATISIVTAVRFE